MGGTPLHGDLLPLLCPYMAPALSPIIFAPLSKSQTPLLESQVALLKMRGWWWWFANIRRRTLVGGQWRQIVCARQCWRSHQTWLNWLGPDTSLLWVDLKNILRPGKLQHTPLLPWVQVHLVRMFINKNNLLDGGVSESLWKVTYQHLIILILRKQRIEALQFSNSEIRKLRLMSLMSRV